MRQELIAEVGAANVAASRLATINQQLIQAHRRTGDGDTEFSDDAAVTGDAELSGDGGLSGATAVPGATGRLLSRRDEQLATLGAVIGATAVIRADWSAELSADRQVIVAAGATAALAVDAASRLQVAGNLIQVHNCRCSAATTVLQSVLPAVTCQLEVLADGLITKVNHAQTQGYDLAGQRGTPPFAGSARRGISTLLTEPAAIAAGRTPGANLDAANALAISGIGLSPGGPDRAHADLLREVALASAQAHRGHRLRDAVARTLASLQTSTSRADPSMLDGQTLEPTSSRLGRDLELARAEQHARSVAAAVAWTTATEVACTRIVALVRRARRLALPVPLAVVAAPSARRPPAKEIESIRGQLIGLANTTQDGRPIFGGTGMASAAYSADGGYVGDR